MGWDMVSDSEARGIAADHATNQRLDPMSILADRGVVSDCLDMFITIDQCLDRVNSAPHLSEWDHKGFIQDLNALRDWVKNHGS